MLHWVTCHSLRRYKPPFYRWENWGSDRVSNLPKVAQWVNRRRFKHSLTGSSLTPKFVPECGKGTAQITHQVSGPPPLPLCSAKLNALQARECGFGFHWSLLLGSQTLLSQPHPILSPDRIVLARWSDPVCDLPGDGTHTQASSPRAPPKGQVGILFQQL